MRYAILILAGLALQAAPASAQQNPLGTGLGSGVGSGIGSGVGSGIGGDLASGLGAPSQRTLGDAFNPNRQALGGGCAPTQADPDHTGCRPAEWIRNEGLNPNRVITYSGDSAFRSSTP